MNARMNEDDEKHSETRFSEENAKKVSEYHCLTTTAANRVDSVESQNSIKH